MKIAILGYIRNKHPRRQLGTMFFFWKVKKCGKKYHKQRNRGANNKIHQPGYETEKLKTDTVFNKSRENDGKEVLC